MQTSSSAVVVRWPDPACMSTGSHYVQLAVCCFAAAGLSNEQIRQQLRRLAVSLS